MSWTADYPCYPGDLSPRLLTDVVSGERASSQLLSALLDTFSRRRDRVAQSKTRNEPLPAFVTLLLVVVDSERLRSQPVLGEVMRGGAAYQLRRGALGGCSE